MMSRFFSYLLFGALVFASPVAFAGHNNSPVHDDVHGTKSPAPSIEKKELDRAQTKVDKVTAAGPASNSPQDIHSYDVRLQRLQGELDAAIARCGNPCN